MRRSNTSSMPPLDHLVGRSLQIQRHRQAERFRLPEKGRLFGARVGSHEAFALSAALGP
jgi:hypothetical protein